MNLAFMHVGTNPEFPMLMLASAIRHCDPQRIYHLTDEHTEPIQGSETLRLHYDGTHMAQFKMEHLAALQAMELLVLDTDVIVQHDLRPIFQLEFDVALTRRDQRIPDVNGVDVTEHMPYNCGVMFCRNPIFWRQCKRFVDAQESAIRRWYGDQYAVFHVSKHFHLLELSCRNFNYTPQDPNEPTDHRYVVHYKGERKQWMLRKHQVDPMTRT